MDIINEESVNVKEFSYNPYQYYYDVDVSGNEYELGGNVSYDFSIDTVNITQKYHGEGRTYEDSVYVDTDDFLEIVAEFLVQNPSAYDELQRKITQKQVY